MNAALSPVRSLFDRRELIGELVSRELRDRHTGQILGVLWAYGHPLALMVLYTVLFAYVFPARFGEGVSISDYSVNVLTGIVPWLAFQDILSRSPTIIVGHGSLVKQIAFPIEVLPMKTALASAMPYTVGLVFVLGYAWWHGTLSMMAITIPLLIIFQLMAMIGTAFLLSAGGVFVRDLREFVSVFCSFNLFAQPILYNPFTTPDLLQWMFVPNPFSYLIWCWQDALFHGSFYHPVAWVVFPVGSVFTLVIGWKAFEQARHQFGDAL